MDFVIGLLGAGIGSGVMAILLAWLNRKWAKEDKHDDKLDNVVTAQKLVMLDRCRFLAKQYIAAGWIALEDKEHLIEMHKAYKALGGNGHLDTIMKEADRLPVVSD